MAEIRQRQREIHGDRGLADAALAAGHRDEIFYAGDWLAFRICCGAGAFSFLFSDASCVGAVAFLVFFP